MKRAGCRSWILYSHGHYDVTYDLNGTGKWDTASRNDAERAAKLLRAFGFRVAVKHMRRIGSSEWEVRSISAPNRDVIPSRPTSEAGPSPD